MKAFRLNGWTVSPCGSRAPRTSYDISAPGENYHYEDLEGAVEAAQRRPGEPLSEALPDELSDKLYQAISEARRDQGIEGGTDYTFRNLAFDVREALDEAREGKL